MYSPIFEKRLEQQETITMKPQTFGQQFVPSINFGILNDDA